MELLNKKLFFDGESYSKESKNQYWVLLSRKYFNWIRTTNTGKEILDRLTGENTINDIIREIAIEYKMPEVIVKEDVINFCEEALKNKFIFQSEDEALEPDFNMDITHLSIDLTNYCNKNCIYCNKDICKVLSKAKFVTLTSIRNYFIKLFPNGKCKNTFIFLTGGEPLFHKDLIKIIEFISTYEAKIILWTNGSIFNEDIATKLKKYNTSIFLSIDSYDEEINDKLRGNGSYQEVINATELCKKKDLKFIYAVTVSKYNIDSFEKLIDLANKENGNGLIINLPIFKNEYGIISNILYDLNDRIFLEKIRSINKRVNIINSWSKGNGTAKHRISFLQEWNLCKGSLFRITKKVNCGAGINYLSIDINSNVYPCKAMHMKDFILGTLPEFNLTRSEYNLPQFLVNSETCKSCEAEIVCLGGCKSNLLSISDNNLMFEQFCNKVKNEMKSYLWAPISTRLLDDIRNE